ncbi:MAG: helix-turn-helix transcriptional regulator [Anaerolineae bacterium]|nr:helix-turn-helix transcriptional regulator [Anaerolineae bacterium]
MAADMTFGKALAQFRKRAGISIFDLTVLMGWKGTGPVIELEKGKRMPRPNTIDRLGVALNLTHSDICFLRGLAGYMPYTTMPTQAQILTVLNAVVDMVREYPFPCYITDYRGIYWLYNPAETALMDMSFEELAHLMRRVTGIFDIVFDSRLGLAARLGNRDQTERDHIFRFKAHNQYRRHERFYLSYPDCMRARLTDEDYARFAAAWNAVEVTLERNKLVYPFGGFMRSSGDVQITLAAVHGFHFDRVEQPILHLNDLFDLVYYRPVGSPDEQQACHAYFASFKWSPDQFTKLWEHVDVQTIIDMYDQDNVMATKP